MDQYERKITKTEKLRLLRARIGLRVFAQFSHDPLASLYHVALLHYVESPDRHSIAVNVDCGRVPSPTAYLSEHILMFL